MDNIDIELFRKRLKKRLEETHKTPKQLAKETGVSESIVWKWLGGKKDDYTNEKKDILPSVQKLYVVSKCLGVTLDYFFYPDTDCIELIKDYTGLSNNAIECLHGWNKDKQKTGLLHQYSNETETINKILEYYEIIRRTNAKKGNLNAFTLFHFIGNYFNAHKFKSVVPDTIRFGSGANFYEIEKGDTIKKPGDKKGKKIETLCTPINKKTGLGGDGNFLGIENSENETEVYTVKMSALYREHAKSQIEKELKKIGGID